MNIYLLTHDIWFYTTLLWTLSCSILSFLVYRKLKPFMHILRMSQLGKRHDVAQPHKVDPVIEGIIQRSSLRDKLHGAKN